MVGTSIIPSRKRLVNEYNHHVYEYRWLDFREHNGSCLSCQESIEFSWRWGEARKLGKVLDALYPDWRTDQ